MSSGKTRSNLIGSRPRRCKKMLAASIHLRALSTRRALAIFVAAAIGAASPGTALGDPAHGTPSTLTLTPESQPQAAKTTIIQATGYNSPTGQGSAYGHFYLDVYALSSAFGSSCPSSWVDAAQNSMGALARARPESADSSGNFSIPLAMNSSAPGPILICGYTDDGTSFGTAASYSLPLTIKPAGSARCVVPRLKGKTLAAARRALRSANCTLGPVTKRRSPRRMRGRVLGQHPAAGTSLRAHGKVALVVGKA